MPEGAARLPELAEVQVMIIATYDGLAAVYPLRRTTVRDNIVNPGGAPAPAPSASVR